MGWFKQPQQDAVVRIQENPLFSSAATASGKGQAAKQQQPTQPSPEQLTSPDEDAQVVSRWLQDPQHRPAHAGTSLRAPAGLHQPEPAAAARAAPHSSSDSYGRGMKGHVPAPLLLPADEPCASSQVQDTADEGCYTPGTVHGADSPPGPMQLPAGHSKAPAHTAAHAAPSTPKATHRLACSTPSTTAKLVQDSHARAPGQHSAVSWQDQGATSGSSSGNWSDGAASAAASLAAHSEGRLTESSPGTPTHRPGSSRRPTSALQRQLQVLLQQQQQQGTSAGSAAVGAAGEDTEDTLFDDMCACFGNLQAAAQLARTESGMTAERLPAAIAAVRGSVDGGARSSSSPGGSRPTSAARQPRTSGSAAAVSGAPHAGSSSSRPASASAARGAPASSTAGPQQAGLGRSSSTTAAPAGSLAATFAAIEAARSSAAGSVSGGRQLERGRSRLHTSTSNAKLLFEDDFEDEGDDYITSPGSPPPDSRNSGNGAGSPPGSLVLLKVGPTGKSVALPDGTTGMAHGILFGCQDRASMVCEGQGRGSGSPGSSRDSSAHDGAVRHSSSSDTSAASAAAAAASVCASGAAVMHGAGPRVQESQQEQQQRAILLQQEQLRLQERRQQKQEQVVASYSCLSPHSPMGARTSRHSFSAGDPSAASSSRANSRPSSGTWALQASRCSGSAVGGDAGCAAPVLAAGGYCSNPAAQANTPGSSPDALDQLRSSSSGVLGTSMPHGMRPASASAASGVLHAGVTKASGSSPVSRTLKASSSTQQHQGERRGAASAAGSLQAPQPPSIRVLSAGAVPSPRAKSAQHAVAAAASLAGIGR